LCGVDASIIEEYISRFEALRHLTRTEEKDIKFPNKLKENEFE
jgi:hypothetical protein